MIENYLKARIVSNHCSTSGEGVWSSTNTFLAGDAITVIPQSDKLHYTSPSSASSLLWGWEGRPWDFANTLGSSPSDPRRHWTTTSTPPRLLSAQQFAAMRTSVMLCHIKHTACRDVLTSMLCHVYGVGNYCLCLSLPWPLLESDMHAG